MSSLKHSVITKHDIQLVIKLKGIFGKLISSILYNILGLKSLNKMYNHCFDNDGERFVENCLNYKNNKIKVYPQDLSHIPGSGACVILFNHPFGALEALMTYGVLMKKRKDVKFVANFLLSRVEPLQNVLVQVNPFENKKEVFSNFVGAKAMHKVIEEGGLLCIFAAGEVSTKYKNSKYIEDKAWPQNIMRFIKTVNAPVISGFIDGQNSRSFHLLGKINPLFRTVSLPRQLLNKKNLEVCLRFSPPLSAKNIKQIENNKLLAEFLKSRTYLLKHKAFVNTSVIQKEYAELVEAQNKDLLIEEIEKIKKTNLLFSSENYLVFFVQKKDIPLIFQDLARSREITFREIGEGTGNASDFDAYDEYYNHLFIWDELANALVGAYRIGMGKHIIEKYGKNGFYLNTLFKFNQGFDKYLEKSMEMGRSFIVQEYQKKTLPLFLLWKGIYFVTQKYPEYKYLIGPASISSIYSENSKILIIEFLKRYHAWNEVSEFVQARNKFEYKLNHHHEKVFEVYKNDLSLMDRLIRDIDINHYSMPVLIKKYLSLGGKILDFNIDPEFNFAIDGLVILDIGVVSQEVINSYNK
ncbi:MAG: GNAT family N-acetyltransferase [Bacteroidales bacterium]|nr:lysophospholipid acyltransferase family protein [Bacteroidales bacterium]NLB85881.1 GNAT family N-acetyltransferase [Bacteroidales bacterium]